MNYTKSDANITHPSGQRMHQSSLPVPTEVSSADLNMVIWSLMEVVKSAGLSGSDFNPDVPATYQVLAKALKSSFVAGDAGKSLRMVSLVARNDGSGWAKLEDADHTAVGSGSVSVTPAGRVRTQFSFEASKVVTLLGTPDETFSQKGVLIGASVGVDYADFQLSMPFSCWVQKTAGVWGFQNLDPWFGAGTQTTISTSSDQGSFTISHQAASENMVPVCCVLREGADTPVPGVECRLSYGADSITGTCYDDFSGYIYFNGTDWVVDTPNIHKPTVTFAGGVLTVEHQALGAETRGLQVSGASGVLHVFAGTTISPTSFTVAFYNYAGASISVASPNMKFRYGRPVKVPSKAPDGMRVALSRGPVALHASSVISEFGNFWVTGLMTV